MRERPPSSVIDEYLVVESQLGDAEAFERLVERWQSRILRHAYYSTQDREAALDVAQESWMAIVRGLQSLRDPGRFRAWALRIVANKASDWVRREQARRRATRRAQIVLEQQDGTQETDAVARVRVALDALESSQRLILAFYYMDEMSIREIAEILSIPVGTVKSRLFHARRALRARLEEE